MKFAAAILFAALLSAAMPSRARADQNFIQALVGDAVITRLELLERSVQGEEFYYRRYTENPTVANSNMLRSNIFALREEVYERTVNVQLVLQEFKALEVKLAKAGVKPIPESEVDALVRQHIQSDFGDDRIRFIKDLQAQGKTLEQYRKELREQLIFEGMRRQYVPEPIVSPQQIENYYKTHQDDYKVVERVKMRTIFLKKSADDADAAKHRAEEILGLLKEGSSFKDLAKSYSETPAAAAAADKDPDWVEISGRSQPIQDALAKIKPGEFTGVIETGEGYFIVLLEARDPAHMRALNDPDTSPRGEIERTLMAQERDRRMKAWIKRLEKRIFIERF